MTSKVRNGAKLFSFDPVSITEGAVSSWFSLAHPSSVITGAGYSSIHDILNPSSALTQSTDARRPPAGTPANGYPIITSTTGVMSCPVIAARANVTTWGFWGWLKQSSTADQMLSYRTVSGANVNRHHMFWNLSGTRLTVEVYSGAGSRFVDIASQAVGTWKFITLEFNGNRSGDARCIITANGAIPTQNYATASGVSEMPATLNAITGAGTTMGLGSGGPFFVGSWGTNFGFFASAMSGASQGLLTTAARLALMNYQRPD